MQEQVLLAHQLADTAGAVITRYFRKELTVDTKADETPVTIADKMVEETLRAMIEAARPEDGILGEEYGVKESKSGFTWVLDPIDGTKSFTIGRPSFGTLIALCRDDVPILGVIDQPILKERWVGDGTQTTFNGVFVKTRACRDLKTARIASTAPSQLPTLWQKLDESCAYTIWGGDCYSYGLLSNGWLDGVIETGLQPYDFAALIPIVLGAGGWMGDWNGKPLTLQSDGRTLAVGDAGLKDELLSLLAS